MPGKSGDMTAQYKGVSMTIRDRLAVLGATQGDLAAATDVSLLSINQLCNGRRRITADMAIRLAIAFHTSREFWTGIQTVVDLIEAENHYLALCGMYSRCKELPGARK